MWGDDLICEVKSFRFKKKRHFGSIWPHNWGKMGKFLIVLLVRANILKFSTFTKFWVLISFLKSNDLHLKKWRHFGPIWPHNWGKMGKFHILLLLSANNLNFGTFTKFGVVISFLKSENVYLKKKAFWARFTNWENFLSFYCLVQIFENLVLSLFLKIVWIHN